LRTDGAFLPTMNRRILAIVGAVLVLVVACLIFPRVLGFVELAARELRYLWWLILIAALGVWLAFFYGRSKR
jgi:asparagine N-glycosylation enzyme membrane subunit Stt3